MDTLKTHATQAIFDRLLVESDGMTREQFLIMKELSNSILATGLAENEWRRRALTAELPTFWQRIFGSQSC